MKFLGFKLFLIMSVCAALLCAPPPPDQGLPSPHASLRAWMQSLSVADSTFQGSGTLDFEPADGMRLSGLFRTASLGDSLFRMDIFAPWGSRLASLRVSGTHYQILSASQSGSQEGEYSDSLLRPYLGLDLPLSALLAVFQGRPYIETADTALTETDSSVTLNKNSLHYAYRLSPKDKRIVSLEIQKAQTVPITFSWDKFHSSRARQCRIQRKDGSAVEILFDQWEWNKPAPENFLDF